MDRSKEPEVAADITARKPKPIVMLDHGNCKWEHKRLADVFIPMHVGPVILFKEKVIQPSLNALDKEIATFTKPGDTTEAYRQVEVQQLRKTTLQSFCPSTHAVFERALRSWISDSLHQVANDEPDVIIELYLFFEDADERCDEPLAVAFALEKLKARVRKDNLWKLKDVVQRFRGVALNDLPCYRVLSLMETVANACRHGDGDAVKKLFHERPDFWPEPLRNLTLQRNGVLGFSSITFPDKLLYAFCDAIVAFWDDLHLVHLCSFGNLSLLIKEEQGEASVLLKKSREYVERLKTNPLFGAQTP
ncbi:hypothetical protein OVY01_22605 [Robbsia sp. Bb-Pol-6]|uniref:Uncharacterized protein n=1 Tax=Robbsia betulipollinis TaxID=2981849 RepID=A0ABT3ZTP8_9BURK|nr:hypothetical protein [Robbsia betulipollinis]MCY0389934.1 hypothetical protein [Robbsia betulipollinis]